MSGADRGAEEKMECELAIPIPSGFPSALHTSGYPYTVRIARDERTVTYVGKGNHALDVGSVRANRPIPLNTEVYYYEVFINDSGVNGEITVGLSSVNEPVLPFSGAGANSSAGAAIAQSPSAVLTNTLSTCSPMCKQVGVDGNGYGYRGDEGRKFHNSGARGQSYAAGFTKGDIIGCGINYFTKEIFFTKNGTNLGVAFGIASSTHQVASSPTNSTVTTSTLYPVVSLHSQGESVTFNFGGAPFRYDVSSFCKKEKAKHESIVAQQSVDRSLLLPLIQQYLLHQGYASTYQSLGRLQDDSGSAVSPCIIKPASASKSTKRKSFSSSESEVSSEVSSLPESSTLASTAPISSNSSSSITVSSSPWQFHQSYTQSLQQRNAIRTNIEKGDIETAINIINSVAPNLLSANVKLRFSLHSLQFLNLVKLQNMEASVEFARSQLKQYVQHPSMSTSLISLMGVLAYPDPVTNTACPLNYLFQPEYASTVAQEINVAILGELGAEQSCSSIELLMRQVLTCDSLLRKHQAGIGAPIPPFS